MARYSCIIGHGSYTPERIVTNHDLPQSLDTNHEWIVERTGIHQRHIAANDQVTSDLATHAAQAALSQANIEASELDLIILATETPDLTMPASALTVQANVGAGTCAAYDLHAACSGYIYAMTQAHAMLQSGMARTALVMGAETFSRVVDWTDRGSCILFGDGAGATILQAIETDNAPHYPYIMDASLHGDGRHKDILCTNGGVSKTQTVGTLTMAGKDVFKHAVRRMHESTLAVLNKQQLTANDIGLLIPHQANWRIMQSIAQKLDLAEDRVVNTVGQHANTSAATIPLAIDVAIKDGRLCAPNAVAQQSSHKIIASPALGAGLTWGCCLIHW